MQVPLNPYGQMIATAGRVDWFKCGLYAEFSESGWMNNKLQYRQRVEYELRNLKESLNLNKTYKKVIYLWVAFILVLIIGVVIAALSNDTNKARIAIIVIQIVLLVALLIVQIYLMIQIPRKIKGGLNQMSAVLQSQNIPLMLRLKSDSCFLKMYGRIYYRFNFIEVYEL